MNREITVEVAYARPDRQLILSLRASPDITAGRAIEMSGMLEKFPEIDLERNKVGVFGRLVSLETVLRDKDRVEIYRPLIADPKAVRRKRAERGKAMKKGGASDLAEGG